MGLIKRTVRRKVKQPVKRAIRRKITRPARRRVEAVASATCSVCGKRYANPLTHTCEVKTDFAKRKRAAEAAEKRRRARERKAATRARQRERARARRKAAADRRKAAAAERRRSAQSRPAPKPRAPRHEYRTCRDDECRQHACMAFKEGFEVGIESCPLSHGG